MEMGGVHLKPLVFNFIRILANSRFEMLKDYANEVEGFIDDKHDTFVKEAEKLTKDFSEEKIDHFWDFYLDDYQQIKSDYPSVLRYSIIISAYTSLEQTLMRVHYQHKKNRNEFKKYKDIKRGKKLVGKRSDIEAIMKYIKNDMKIKLPYDYPSWDFISDLNKVRNNIAHNNGRIYDDKDPARLFKIIKQQPYIDVTDSNEILIEKEFTEIMLNNIIGFFDTLFDCIDQSTPASK
jgi:hypothetical protein